MKLKTLLFTVLTATVAFSAQAEAVLGKDYVVRDQPLLSVSGKDKIEVTEFFGYFCPHCRHFDPMIRAQEKRFASDTVLRTEHVVWQPQMLVLARLAAAVHQAGVTDQANPAIYDAMVEKRLNLADDATLKDWLQQQPFGAKVLAAYNMPNAARAADEMQQLTRQYGIQSTPTVIVDGKYQLLFPNGFEAGIQTMNELIAKARAERGLKPVANRAPLRSRGSSFAAQANQ